MNNNLAFDDDPDLRERSRDMIFVAKLGATFVEFCLDVQAVHFHFSQGNHESRLAGVRKRWHEVQTLARWKCPAGWKESDGPVVIAAEDVAFFRQWRPAA